MLLSYEEFSGKKDFSLNFLKGVLIGMRFSTLAMILFVGFLFASCAQPRTTTSKATESVTIDTFRGADLEIKVKDRHIGKSGMLIVLACLNDQWYIYDDGSWLEFGPYDQYIGITKPLKKTENIWIPKNDFPHSDIVDVHFGYEADGEFFIDQFYSVTFKDF